MSKSKIEWCNETWNPIVGCERNCYYCYARDLHNKRHEAYLKGKLQNFKQYAKSFNEIQFLPERLEKPCTTKKPSTIFVGSMSDPEYWDQDNFEDIINVCKNHPQHTFMFLTKNWGAYCNFSFPNNVVLGITLTFECVIDCSQQMYGFKDIKKHRKFISIEPLLGCVKQNNNIYDYEQIIVGPMTGKNSIAPKKEWIDSIKKNIPEDKIFWKNNIKKYL